MDGEKKVISEKNKETKRKKAYLENLWYSEQNNACLAVHCMFQLKYILSFNSLYAKASRSNI